MTYRNIYLTMLIFTLIGCRGPDFDEKAVITGNVEKNINGEIYLVDVAKKDIIKDSATVTDGRFNFTFKTADALLPFEARLCLPDKFNNVKYLRPIGFLNPYKENYIESVFYVDRGVTYIGKKTHENNFCCYEIKGSKQNEPYYLDIRFSELDKNKNASERGQTIMEHLSLIKKYPYSLHLLNLLYINREQYTNDELNLLMRGFNDEVKAFSYYHKLVEWTSNKEKGEINISDITLRNEKYVMQPVFDTASKISMLVFWASWCSPCIKEIPKLKEIYNKYHDKGLLITSISLDINENNWRNSLEHEKMPWKQLIVNEPARNLFDLKYNISTIPVVVLIDMDKKLIQRFSGLSEVDEFSKYLAVLDKK